MRKFIVCFIAICLSNYTYSQQFYKPIRPVKNVILMIPDGTSIGVVSSARWYQIFNKLGSDNLNIDPYFCGTVKTFSSNAPIGDSAPTTSSYVTGMQQQTGNIAIYPPADPGNDLIYVDPAKAYQPLTTILEAAKSEQNKSTGLVVTCEFPHATPADCSSHYYDRNAYDPISSQMVYNNLDVVIGGGNSLITEDMKNHFKRNGTNLIQSDLNAFRNHNNGKLWALFADRDLPYDIDRNADSIPSLAETTKKAIDLLSQNDNGFFLMVEGSKVDWSAHANDAVGCITEFLAFDRAVGVAIDFAKKNGETAVIILPDHGNSGFTLGNRNLKGYDKASISKLFEQVSKYKKTSEGLEKILQKEDPQNYRAIIKEYTDIDLSDQEYARLLKSRDYKKSDDYMKIRENENMTTVLIDIMNSRTYFGFTTNGHTGEDVFLAVYHPQGDIPNGMNLNTQINDYLFDVMGFKTPLNELTEKKFAKHTDVFKNFNYKIDKSDKFPTLIVKHKKNTLEIPAFKSIAILNGKTIDLESVVVYMDKNDTFYLPKNLADLIK